MVELNAETVSGILTGLSVLKKFSYISDDVKFVKSAFSINAFDNVDDWLFSIVEALFTHEVKRLSDEFVEGTEEISKVLDNYDTSVSSYYYSTFLQAYGYDGDDEVVVESETFNDNLGEFYAEIGVKKMEVVIPLINEANRECTNFLRHIPSLIEDHFNMGGNVLLGSSIEYSSEYSTYVVSLHYVYDYSADFSFDLYIPDLIEDFIELLTYHIKLNSKRMDGATS